MEVQVLSSAEDVARAAADFMAAEARAAVATRGRFTVAVSGGRTPWQMLRLFADRDVPWTRVHLFQVDERVAPAGHPDRNLTHLQASLRETAAASAVRVHPMPVEEPDLDAAAREYRGALMEFAGDPPALDLIHLGLGADGHTASLIPGDPVLDVADRDVAMTGIYQQRRRMTLTYPVLNRARRILWVVTGGEKAPMLDRLRTGDSSIPAGRVNQEHALVLADRGAER